MVSVNTSGRAPSVAALFCVVELLVAFCWALTSVAQIAISISAEQTLSTFLMVSPA